VCPHISLERGNINSPIGGFSIMLIFLSCNAILIKKRKYYVGLVAVDYFNKTSSCLFKTYGLVGLPNL
jgi:hypothetical protein